MRIQVTEHARDRYRQRTMRFRMTESEITGNLTAAALRGKRIAKRAGNSFEVEYQNLIIVVLYENDLITVITCLGDKRYREWSRRHEIKPRRQRRAG